MVNLEDTTSETTEPDFSFTQANPFKFEDTNLFVGWALKVAGNYKVHTVDTKGFVEFQLRLVGTDGRIP